jgi:hypothetical protein
MAKACGGIAFALFVHLWWRSAGGRFAGPFLVDLAPGPAAAWDLALLAFFFVAHSVFASLWFKRRLPLARHTTRRLYLILTLPVTLAMWAFWVPLPGPVLWDVRGIAALPIVFIAVRLLAFAGLIWTVRSFNLADFFGTSAGVGGGGGSGAAVPGALPVMSVEGAFALCRHPLYFFMTLLAAATTTMPLGRALMAAGLVVYVIIGSRLEETKLEGDFGPAYARYRAQTPWLIPSPRSIARALGRSSNAVGV